MNKKLELKGKKKLLFIVIVVLLIAIIGIVIVRSGAFDMLNETPKNTVNYTTRLDGAKINISEKLSEDKKVGKILLEKNSIVYSEGMSKLTSKVTNDNKERESLRFKVKFIANDKSVIAESVGFIGKIGAKESKYIYSYITSDVSNASNVIYEIME